MNNINIREQILTKIKGLVQGNLEEVSEEMPLIGSGSPLDSMKIVELCIVLEDLACELDFEFDWTSDSAMSRSRGMFKTAGTLVNEFLRQMEEKK